MQTELLAFLAGIVLGALFYGGLWWTVERGLRAGQPALLFFGSFIVRMGLALLGFYYVSRGHLTLLIACLAGFLAGRVIVSRWIKRTEAKVAPKLEDSSNAP